MEFAVSYSTPFYGVDPDGLLAYARHAEACGFTGFYVPEHVAMYVGAERDGMPMALDLPFLDPIDTLAFVAAATDRITLGIGVLLLPYHHPVTLAKRLATVDVLSGGRLRLLTVGVGALPGEAAAVGIDFTTRGRRADEAIDVLRLLWTGGPVSHEGEFYQFNDITSFPRPYGGELLPIHIGGSSAAAARRAGRRGDGFFPGGMLMPQERARQWEIAQSAAAEAGRSLVQQTRWGSIDLTPDRVAAYESQGVTRLVVAPGTADPKEQRDQLTAFAERHRLTDR